MRRRLVFIFALALVGCGGGDSGSDTTIPAPRRNVCFVLGPYWKESGEFYSALLGPPNDYYPEGSWSHKFFVGGEHSYLVVYFRRESQAAAWYESIDPGLLASDAVVRSYLAVDGECESLVDETG